MTHQHRIVPGSIEPAIDRIMQRGIGQRAPALQQQVPVENEIALVGGLQRSEFQPVPASAPGIGLRS